MKITLIGSTQYKQKFLIHKKYLEKEKHQVRIPAFDDHKKLDELEVCKYNLKLIKWADEVHIIWDRRSTGTIFDFGMIFALRKPIKIIYLESKTFEGVMKKYENSKGIPHKN